MTRIQKAKEMFERFHRKYSMKWSSHDEKLLDDFLATPEAAALLSGEDWKEDAVELAEKEYPLADFENYEGSTTDYLTDKDYTETSRAAFIKGLQYAQRHDEDVNVIEEIAFYCLQSGRARGSLEEYKKLYPHSWEAAMDEAMRYWQTRIKPLPEPLVDPYRKWQPISTAPKDGTTIEVSYSEDGSEPCFAMWSKRPVCMGGPTVYNAPGWATAPESDTDTNLPMDEPLVWRNVI